MKHINISNKTKRSGFTLIEMIGVLAIIAVLAGLLLPRIFGAINEARINGAALSFNSAKTASVGYFGKYGRFGDATGAALTVTSTAQDWGAILLTTGFLDKPFATKVGATGTIEIVASAAANAAVDGSNSSYSFDGLSVTNNQAAGGAAVIQIKLTGVALDDAQELSRRIDGESLSTTTGADFKGKVKYDASTGDVLMYIAHK